MEDVLVGVGCMVTLGSEVTVGVSSELNDASIRRDGIEVPRVLLSDSPRDVGVLDEDVMRSIAASVMV